MTSPQQPPVQPLAAPPLQSNPPQQFTPPARPLIDAPQGPPAAPGLGSGASAIGADPSRPTDPTPAPDPASEPAATPYGFDEKGRVQRTKISGVWIGLIAAVVVLILLIIFIGQNLNKVGLHFLGFYGQVSFGLALLVAAISGVLIAAVPGTVRIMQLRKSLRRNVDLPGTKHKK